MKDNKNHMTLKGKNNLIVYNNSLHVPKYTKQIPVLKNQKKSFGCYQN